MLRWPSLRRPLDVLFLFACFALSAYVLAPELFGSGKTKDYALWFWAGEQMLGGGPLYERMTRGTLDFIYPPTPAIMLAAPAYFGKVALYSVLCALNVASWWIVIRLADLMAAERRVAPDWLVALPVIATLPMVYDQFDLGQPNLVLLVLMLLGLWLLQRARPVGAGALFAVATAIKAFPIVVLPYLLWRRHFLAAASLVVWLLALLYVLPAPVRGFERNAQEVATWYRAMVGSASDQGFGQRATQNWSWINQSLVAVTHRLVRPVNWDDDDRRPPRTMNVVDVSYAAANGIVLAMCALIGLAFIAVLPSRRRLTPRLEADEFALLFCLMTIASPLARQYYFVWLFLPVAVLSQRAWFDPRPAVRRATWAVLAGAGVLLALSLPAFPLLVQAWGNNLAATALLALALGWHLRHPPHDVAADAA